MLSDLVTTAACRHGDACAYRDPEQALTFAEMDARTAILATFLQKNGVGEGDRVAICMPSSVLTALCVHGVFRAGAAFVPVDPDAPPRRIRAVIADCGVRHVLSVPELRDKVRAAISGLNITALIGTGNDEPSESTWDEVWGTKPALRNLSRDTERLAYVMYTSGSTGTPKGIAHTHRSAMAYVTNSQATYAVGPGDVLATTGPLHFDVSTFVFLTAPAAGATGFVVPQPYTRLPASLAQVLDDAGVTIFYTTVSALSQIVDRGALATRDLAALRWVLFCGEPMPPVQLGRAMAALPHAWFSNSYGPAEVNQCTYRHFAPGTDPAALEHIPIGRPWSGAVCKLLNGNVEAARDEAGELVVSTQSMMSGYWNRPDLNDGAFHLDTDGRVYYRTGDIARRNSDDELILVGRADRQVKIRGYRVELDEIEVHLANHPDIVEAAVFSILTDGTVTGIGAAVVTALDDPVSERNLFHYLRARLPAYAVPTFIDVMRALPRTSSGKIDRRQLSLSASEPTGAPT